LLEELSFHLYPRPSQQLRLFLVAVFENFGYRQLTSVWRLAGLLRWVSSALRGRRRWGKIRRHASWQHEPDVADAVAMDTRLPRNDDTRQREPTPA
jgi:hypothetical protein